MRWLAVTALLLLSGFGACKRSSKEREPRVVPVAPSPAPGSGGGTGTGAGSGSEAAIADPPADPAPEPALPPPSEELSAPPADIAEHVRLETVATGFDRPGALVVAPGDARRRLFVVEQVGRIRVIENGDIPKQPVLDLRALVSRENEQGLLGLAFHPKFAENHKLFIDYTDRAGDTRVVEMKL